MNFGGSALFPDKLLFFVLTVTAFIFMDIILREVLLPSVTIVNGSQEVIYLKAEIAPDAELADTSRRIRVVRPGLAYKVSASYADLYEYRSLYIKWGIGKHPDYAGGGVEEFMLTTSEGACSIILVVRKGGSEVRREGLPLCLERF